MQAMANWRNAHGKTEKETAWPAPRITPEQAAVINKTMTAQVARSGGMTKDNAARLVKNRTVERLLGQTKHKPADAVWAWVAEQQEKGNITKDITRKVKGSTAIAEPFWQNAAMLRVGWLDARDMGITVRELKTIQNTQRVWEAIMRHSPLDECSQGESNAEKSEKPEHEEEQETQQIATVTAKAIQAAWQSTKKQFTGKGGKETFWLCVGLLMTAGKLQGSVGPGPKDGRWWEEAQELGGSLGEQKGIIKPLEKKKVKLCRGGKATRIRVGVDVMACTHSAEEAMEETGLVYVPMDIEEWVYSARTRTWVQNIACDFLENTAEEVTAKIQGALQERYTEEIQVVVAAVWASPDCRTFSKADSSNRNKGCGYRDHQKESRPPLQPASTKWGLRAREADKLVKAVLLLIKAWDTRWPGLAWVLENPVGSLCRREYMQKNKLPKHKLVLIHYCAFNHIYNKPTHLWTNIMNWEPKGTTGTGLCEQKCGMGKWSEKGKFKHEYTIARESHKEMAGVGRKAFKNMVPLMLQREVWGAWLRR